jgi:hypothetical protein
MIYANIDTERLPHWLAQNHVVGLAFDRLPNGRVVAAEIRKDEEGELRVPLAEMDTDSFYRLAQRLNLPILDSKIASEQELASHRQAMRRLAERAETAKELRGERQAEGWNKPEGGAL